MPKSADSFGTFVRQLRRGKGLGLNESARLMKVSGAYLSRVENGLVGPSGQLIQKMSEAYGVPVGDLADHAPKQEASKAAHLHAMQANRDLRALYRLVEGADSDLIEQVIRKILEERGITTEEEVQRYLAKLRAEFPRVRNGDRDGLFAADAKPRFLSSERIARLADDILARNGVGEASYSPPTPIEWIVESEPEVVYRIDELDCSKAGDPLVLGVTRWGERGEREIILSGKLADSRRESDRSRFNFTLAHELFHALEHLPRIPQAAAGSMARVQTFVDLDHSVRRSAAHKAVTRWMKEDECRRLTTNEDWREWQSNMFAAAILMPESALKAQFRARVGGEQILVGAGSNSREAALDVAGQTVFETDVWEQSLAQLFAVSRQAMAIRLLQLGLVREATS